MLQVTDDDWDVGDLNWDKGAVPTRTGLGPIRAAKKSQIKSIWLQD